MSEAEAQAQAQEAHSKRQKFLSLDELADPSVVVSCRDGSLHRLLHMGRALTKEIVEFIDVKLPVYHMSDGEFYVFGPGEKLPLEDARAVEEVGLYGFRYITGLPGTGKSTSLKMAVKYLSARYTSERPVTRRIVLVDGNDFFTNPERALSLALRETGMIIVGPEDVFTFLRSSEVRYTIVVDDGNKIPPSSFAATFLGSLVRCCVVVFCASVCSEWTDVIRKPKTHHYKLVTKGLEGAELEQFCERYDIDRKLLDMGRTGSNPRLMLEYKRDIAEFEKLSSGLEVEATKFLQKAVSNGRDRDHVLTAMTGIRRDLRPLDRMLDSKCFYVAEDGSLECITDGLRGFCSVKLVQLIQEDDPDRLCELIALLTHAISKEKNTIRIGWNAEVAVLVALTIFNLPISYATDTSFSTGGEPAFEIFEGQMSADKLCGVSGKKAPRLYAPKSFDHMGLGFYLELEDMLVAFQVSVAMKAELRHPNTVETAEELFRAGGKRVNVLIFVIPCSSFSSEQAQSVKYAGLSYYHVKMAFGDLSSKLQVIDKRLQEIRELSAWDNVVEATWS